MKEIWKDFKKFIMRGNVVDMAIAVIIGSAFTAIVTSFTNDIIMPLINLAMGGKTLAGQCLVLNNVPKYVVDSATGAMVLNPEAITWNYGNLLQAVIRFLIIALILFFILRVYTRFRKRINIRVQIQEKLDKDEELNKLEARILKRWQKKSPETAPKKAEPQPEAPKAPTEAELLTKLCVLMEENNQMLKNGK